MSEQRPRSTSRVPEPRTQAVPVHAATRTAKTRSSTQTQSKDSSENRGRAAKGMLFLVAVIGYYIINLIVTGQMSTFLASFKTVSRPWLVGAIISYALYYLFGVISYGVAVWLDHDSPVGVRDLMSVEASGTFFGNLTPAQVGSMPAQVLRLTNAGLDPGEAAATQLTRGILLQVASVGYGAVVLLIGFATFRASYGNIIFLALVAWLIGFLTIAGQLAVCMFPNQVMRIGNACVKWLTRRGWLKNYNDAYQLINTSVTELSDAFERARGSQQGILVTLIIDLIQLTCLYMIPWFVANAFGFVLNPVASLEMCALVQMVGAAVPLPGGTGGVDVAWNIFFGPTFGSLTTAGFVMWRAIAYIGPILAAIPFLRLRSQSTQSIYQRWNNVVHGVGHTAHAHKVKGEARGVRAHRRR